MAFLFFRNLYANKYTKDGYPEKIIWNDLMWNTMFKTNFLKHFSLKCRNPYPVLHMLTTCWMFLILMNNSGPTQLAPFTLIWKKSHQAHKCKHMFTYSTMFFFLSKIKRVSLSLWQTENNEYIHETWKKFNELALVIESMGVWQQYNDNSEP